MSDQREDKVYKVCLTCGARCVMTPTEWVEGRVWCNCRPRVLVTDDRNAETER